MALVMLVSEWNTFWPQSLTGISFDLIFFLTTFLFDVPIRPVSYSGTIGISLSYIYRVCHSRLEFAYTLSLFYTFPRIWEIAYGLHWNFGWLYTLILRFPLFHFWKVGLLTHTMITHGDPGSVRSPGLHVYHLRSTSFTVLKWVWPGHVPCGSPILPHIGTLELHTRYHRSVLSSLVHVYVYVVTIDFTRLRFMGITDMWFYRSLPLRYDFAFVRFLMILIVRFYLPTRYKCTHHTHLGILQCLYCLGGDLDCLRCCSIWWNLFCPHGGVCWEFTLCSFILIPVRFSLLRLWFWPHSWWPLTFTFHSLMGDGR